MFAFLVRPALKTLGDSLRPNIPDLPFVTCLRPIMLFMGGIAEAGNFLHTQFQQKGFLKVLFCFSHLVLTLDQQH